MASPSIRKVESLQVQLPHFLKQRDLYICVISQIIAPFYKANRLIRNILGISTTDISQKRDNRLKILFTHLYWLKLPFCFLSKRRNYNALSIKI